MTNIRTVLAVNMKARRKELKLSQAELAEKIGTSPNYISKIEDNKKDMIYTQIKYAHILMSVLLVLICIINIFKMIG